MEHRIGLSGLCIDVYRWMANLTESQNAEMCKREEKEDYILHVHKFPGCIFFPS